MDPYGVVLFLLMALYAMLFMRHRGGNSMSPNAILEDIVNAFKITPLSDWGKKYKEKMKNLSKSGFVRFKMKGVVPTKKSQLKASRGYDKLKDILTQTKIKPEGRVLSVCCGRGGWEQLIAPFPLVTGITSVTYGKGPGHEGHENFTEKFFPAREKIQLYYADARSFPLTDHEFILFDGGEANNDSAVEAARFNNLLDLAVIRQITSKTRGFVIKILTPWDATTLSLMKKIQNITGKGSLVRSVHSRTSTLELYLVSGPKMNLEQASRNILVHALERGLVTPVLKPRDYKVGYNFAREEIAQFPEMLKPLDMSKSIEELGPSLPEERRNFVHWESLGIYPWGIQGSAVTRFNKFTFEITRTLMDKITGLMGWKATDTTPAGFMGVFNRKVDVPPKENHKHRDALKRIYLSLADYFKHRGFVWKELPEEELVPQLNKQGAATRQDLGCNNIGEFLQDKNWRKKIEATRKSFLEGTPVGGVFNTMGKREKKMTFKNVAKGSRMVAYLPIPTRILEMKIFGCLMKLTKPLLNRFGVGGLGLHDLGMRLAEVWGGAGLSTDIAGFDTRISLFLLSMENMFIQRLGGTAICEALYRLYAYPHILIPVADTRFNRSELVCGRGQRMSGTAVTYAMNTITRIVILLYEHGYSCGVKDWGDYVSRVMAGKRCPGCGNNIGGVVSGDDSTLTSTESACEMTSRSCTMLHDIGMPVKDTPAGMKVAVSHTIEEVEFCSHHYEKITYYDSETGKTMLRWMPTRDVSEIVAKSSIRVSGVLGDLSDEAWMSAQGNQLLVMYHHLRTVRAIGLVYKALASPYIILTERGGEFRQNPWMRPGQILEVTNEVLFGGSTYYPSPGFRVREFGHLGYINRKREIAYDQDIDTRVRIEWRKKLPRLMAEVAERYALSGDLSTLELWRRLGFHN